MSDATAIPSPVSEPKRRNKLAEFFGRLVREKPLGTACGITILILILGSIFADVLAPYPYFEMHLADRLTGSSAQYLLGTDQLGRDLLSRILYGARISLVVGLAATALSVTLSSLIGGLSGFLGGKFDLLVQRFCDAWETFPGLILLLTVMSIAGRGLPQIILVLGISGGLGGSRVIRGWVMSLKENDYFLAAEATGCTKWTAFMRHVVPNVMPVVIIGFSMSIGGIIMSEASLSFLGFGLPIEFPSWGGMLSREGREFMEHGAMAGSLAWSLPDCSHLQSKHVRRRHARPARPQAQGQRELSVHSAVQKASRDPCLSDQRLLRRIGAQSKTTPSKTEHMDDI